MTDVAVLKNDAYRSLQVDNNLELAEQLWIRIIAATYGRDMEALQAYRSISQRNEGRSSSSQQSRSVNEKSEEQSIINLLPTIEPPSQPKDTLSDSKLNTSSGKNIIMSGSSNVTTSTSISHWLWLIAGMAIVVLGVKLQQLSDWMHLLLGR
ncbi:MAG: hypothetical protein HC895_02200 [Leptolyngbyaceae cyanobacterium SM1_3_5]|nr:hypothetical protein [Leptolyngbyaceae cyanobacterium SM1_3_5]